MSIEAMKQVIELYDTHCYNNDYGGIEFNKKHGYKFIEAIEALRAAIQQAEAQQPATPEPVVSRNPFASRCYTMSESHLSGHRLIVGFEKLGDVQDAHEWVARQARGDFTHPAPGVPDDTKRLEFAFSGHETDSNALVLLELRRLNGETPTIDEVRTAIYAAMLAAYPAQKGHE